MYPGWQIIPRSATQNTLQNAKELVPKFSIPYKFRR